MDIEKAAGCKVMNGEGGCQSPGNSIMVRRVKEQEIAGKSEREAKGQIGRSEVGVRKESKKGTSRADGSRSDSIANKCISNRKRKRESRTKPGLPPSPFIYLAHWSLLNLHENQKIIQCLLIQLLILILWRQRCKRGGGDAYKQDSIKTGKGGALDFKEQLLRLFLTLSRIWPLFVMCPLF